MAQGLTRPRGSVTAKVIRGERAPLSYRVRNLVHLWSGYWRHVVAQALGISHLYGRLHAVVKHADGSAVNYGLISTRVVTTAGVGFIVDAFQNLVELELMRFHGAGTGTTAEAVGDIALGAEVTLGLNPDSTRPTGTLAEGASANIYRTVGTLTFDAAAAITEHGIFNQAATGGGVLLDRSVFAAINVAAGDSIQFTYELTVSAGG